jgi:hypothetical protein
MLLVGAVPAGAVPPDYEEVPFSDGATCNFTGEEASYGTPGYPETKTQTVLQNWYVFEDGQGRVHQSISILFDGVRYDLIDGDGPPSFLAYGTMTGHGWYELDENEEVVEAFISFGWRWTLTDLAGNSLGTSSGRIVDFAVAAPRLVHNWHGPCIEP